MNALLLIVLLAQDPGMATAPPESYLTNTLIVSSAFTGVAEWSFSLYGLGQASVTETNKLWAITGKSPIVATLGKTAITAALTYLLAHYRHTHRKLVRIVAGVASVGFGAIAVHNARAIQRK